VESFRLDHTRVRAPYVRLAKRVPVPGGSHEVLAYDLRLRTPNTELLSPRVTHSLEHLLAVSLRSVAQGTEEVKVLDVSPMGCRTGFYLTFLSRTGRLSLERVVGLVEGALDEALGYERVPGASVESCGGYEEHDLAGARDVINGLRLERLVALKDPPLLH